MHAEGKLAKSRSGLVVFARAAETAGTEASERPTALRLMASHLYKNISTSFWRLKEVLERQCDDDCAVQN
jgi:hypothetical protein